MCYAQNGGNELYAGDGSVDINGKPVLKHNTGNWKACFFIIGILFIFPPNLNIADIFNEPTSLYKM